MNNYRGTDYSDTASKDAIYVGGEIPPDSSWWATAPRQGFTAYARETCDRHVTTHGRKRGPEFKLPTDRPVVE